MDDRADSNQIKALTPRHAASHGSDCVHDLYECTASSLSQVGKQFVHLPHDEHTCPADDWTRIKIQLEVTIEHAN